MTDGIGSFTAMVGLEQTESLGLPIALTYADALTFVQNLTPTWVKPQQVILMHLLQALQERPTLCASDLARALPDGPHGQAELSLHGRLKRLNRFLDNPRLDETSLFVRWFHLAVRFSARRRTPACCRCCSIPPTSSPLPP